MLLVVIAAAPLLHLRPDAPPLTPYQARSLTPQALGTALLERGAPAVSEAQVGPRGMEPPTPPGRPDRTRIGLFLEPQPSKFPGFCERIIATVILKPVFRSPEGTLPPAAPDTLSTQTAYRWASPAHCSGPESAFFIPDQGQEQATLATVRLLADAVRKAGRRTALPFAVTVDDREGRMMAAFDRAHPELPRSSGWEAILDARKALAELPMDDVRQVELGYPPIQIFEATDLAEISDRGFQKRILFLGGDWWVGMILDHQRIVRIRLLREIPPPF